METKVNKEEQNELKQNRERGASLVEYAILTAIVVTIAVAALNGPFQQAINNAFQNVTNQVDTATGAAGGGDG